MTDAETTVLYTLSTLAQTCAALAAFVGAVGIFHLQLLREERREAEQEMRRMATRVTSIDMQLTPTKDVRERLDQAARKRGAKDVHVVAARLAHDTWAAYVPRMESSRRALAIFEGWNLLVVGVALVGFNYVPSLSASSSTFWGIWAAGVGTVAVTGYCVIAWTRG